MVIFQWTRSWIITSISLEVIVSDSPKQEIKLTRIRSKEASKGPFFVGCLLFTRCALRPTFGLHSIPFFALSIEWRIHQVFSSSSVLVMTCSITIVLGSFVKLSTNPSTTFELASVIRIDQRSNKRKRKCVSLLEASIWKCCMFQIQWLK